jgi:8-oxo-dGTP pyrophosphatase MutT (NUDIX family)
MTGPEILLVTSRDTGRWVIPKGWPMGSKAGHKVAAQEALEEAGVIGEAEHRAFGTYSYEKAMPEGVTIPCDVYVHLLKMKSCTKSFKEKGKRLIEWVSPDVAAERVQEPELKALIQTFEQRFEAKKS